MTVYDGSPQADLLLIEWWTRMAATMDLEQTFSVVHASAGAFFQSFRPPNTLIYKVDEQGIWFAAWFDPVLSGAFYGLWIAPHMRATMGAVLAMHESVRFGLDRFPVLIGAARDVKVAEAAVFVGARVLGDIPHIFDGESATIVYMTTETVRAHQRGNNSTEVVNG